MNYGESLFDSMHATNRLIGILRKAVVETRDPATQAFLLREMHGMGFNDEGSPPELEPIVDHGPRADALEDAVRRLWPFIRYFPLAGAHPNAVVAVLDLGRLIGEISEESAGEIRKEHLDEAIDLTRVETINAIAEWLDGSAVARKIGRRFTSEIVREIRALSGEGEIDEGGEVEEGDGA